MNAKAVVAALQPLEGHRIHILTATEAHAFAHMQPCLRIQHLPPDQRQDADQGNIILWDGGFTSEGLQTGGTFWAKNIHAITWEYDLIAKIHTRDGTKTSIIKLWKLDTQKGNQ
jgi:hypothetical protein